MLSSVQTFDETNDIGKAGEKIMQSYFIDEGCPIRDLSDDLDWRAEDVDLEVTFSERKNYYEIKTDTEMWMTRNVFLELSMERKRSGIVSEGWFTASSAEYLCYLCAGTGTFYIMSFDSLRKYVKNGTAKYTRFDNRIDKDCIGSGLLVNIFQLNKDGLILHKGVVNTSPLWKFAWEKPLPF